MPVYEYEHLGRGCGRGKRFDIRQEVDAKRLTDCPACGRPVHRIFSLVNVNTPKTNSDLKKPGLHQARAPRQGRL